MKIHICQLQNKIICYRAVLYLTTIATMAMPSFYFIFRKTFLSYRALWLYIGLDYLFTKINKFYSYCKKFL